MKKLFEEQRVSIYKVQQDLGLDHARLYRYVSGTTKIENMPTKLILDLANYFKIEPNQLFKEMKEYERKRKRLHNRKINSTTNTN